jgi:hypothetical protein
VLWAIAILLALVVSGAGIYWADPGGVRALGQHVLAVFVSPTPTVEPQITTTPQNKPQILPATLSPVVRETSDANEETTALTTTRSISQTGTAAALGETPSLSVTTTTESIPQTDDVPTQRPSRTATTLSEEPAPSTTLPQNPTDTPLAQPTEPVDDPEPLIVPTATPVDVQSATEQPATEQPAPEQPVATDTVEPDTNTIVETLPTNTPEAIVMDTPLPAPTDTPLPAPTDTPLPAPTDTPLPAPTDTPLPAPTDTPAPLPTDTPEPDTEAPVPPTATPPALIDSDAFSMESIR